MFSKLAIFTVLTLAATIPNTTPPCCRGPPVALRPFSASTSPPSMCCSPITVAGNNCAGTEVTCEAPDSEWGSGLIAINCIPITA
ncbi:hypothetical protein C8R43DRAFT_1118852 [Mycena crocata]|nr:hypothetical protein C8R43DRAFT_1118852 [Mycena crocata]